MNFVSTPLFPWPIRHLGSVIAAVLGGWLGFHGGEALAYAIAGWTDRDIAELKDMLIWSMIAGAPIGALAAIWLVLILTRCSREAQRIPLIGVGAAALLGGFMMLSSFDWPKESGTPLVMYEIRMPTGMPVPRRDKADVVLWSEKSGRGCYVADLRREDDRVVIAGSFLVGDRNDNQMLSLRLDRGAEGYWRMPVRADAKLEKSFGPWLPIQFMPGPRETAPALPAGDYEVRYRVKKYM